ncbi:MAG: polysaccharide biosynthesis/export family protein [Tabrizicola sp.]
MTVSVSHTAKVIAFLAALSLVASCGLPRSGPNKREIIAGSVEKKGDAHIVTVTPAVTRATSVQPVFGFSQAFRNAGVVASDMISPGDTINVTVYENVKDDPLLGNTGQRVSGLADVQVDGQGFIYIPYAGRIKAAGQTPEGLRQAITRKLENQTPDPQVSVSRVAGGGATVSISGQAGLNGVYPIEASTRTLATMLAKAGGVTIDPAITIVRVTRGKHTGKIWLNDLYDNPSLDIALRPGDKINIEKDDRKFIALGATGAQSVVPFESESMSALEAIATVGGLSTMSADPTGVFILRDESEEIARAVLGRNDLIGDQRIVYVLDLTEPTGLFEARDFQIRDGDTLYVTEAPFVQWQKTLGAITGSTSAATSLANVADSGG